MSVKVNIPKPQGGGFSPIGFIANTAKGVAGGAALGPGGMIAGGVLGGAGSLAPHNKAIGAANTAFGVANMANGFNGGGSKNAFADQDLYKPGMLGSDYNLAAPAVSPDDSYQAIQRRFTQGGNY